MRNFCLKRKNLITICFIFSNVFLILGIGYMEHILPEHVYVNRIEEIENTTIEHLFEVKCDSGKASVETFETTSQGPIHLEAKLYLLGAIPVKEVDVVLRDEECVYAGGEIVGIYGSTTGVFVIDTTSVEALNGINYSPVEEKIYPGDYIVAVNGKEVENKKMFVDEVNQSEGAMLDLTINRLGKIVECSVSPVPIDNKRYLLGLWIKDDVAGIGTLTYMDEEGNFGALGHGISDGETGTLLEMEAGNLYETKIVGKRKGEVGTPGEIRGVITYCNETKCGDVSSNAETGIYGKVDTKSELYQEIERRGNEEESYYPIAYKQDIKKDTAYMISSVNGEMNYYEIEILDIDNNPKDINKGISFRVTDQRLLEETGGIIQGMSGSPIIQDGKIVGAVTHVLINDPTMGYGIFIENMLTPLAG